MTDEYRSYFCIHCGAKIHENDEFCPSCGSSTKEDANHVTGNQTAKYSGVSKNYLMAAMAMLIIWAAFAAWIGLTTVFNIDFIIDTAKSDPAAWAQIIQVVTESELRSILSWVGYLFIASALLALVSTLFCAVKKYFAIALVACIAAVVLSTVFAIVGIIVIYLIYKSRGFFDN